MASKKKNRKTCIGKPLTVIWEDAWHSMEYVSFDEIKAIPCMLIASTGLCIRDDEDAVTLAMDALPDGRFRDTKTVPRGMVREVIVLEDR